MRTLVLVAWYCHVVGLTTGQSLFKKLGITTPKSPYSPGISSINQIKFSLTTIISSAYGPHYTCSQDTDVPGVCHCVSNYIGISPQCRPTPEYWDVCIKDNPCGRHSECEVTTNGTRVCSCVSGFNGSAPNCLPDPEHVFCDGDDPCGPNSECSPIRRQCRCLPGYVGTPPNCTAGAELLALCDPYPCGGHANCSVQDGGPVCSCLPGYVGDPPRCSPGPELWRVCFEDAPCGQQSWCTMTDRVAVCSPCADGFYGEPPSCKVSHSRVTQP